MNPIQRPRKSNRYDDLLGLLGGAGCLGLSEIDPAWGAFWLAAGVLLIAWSVGAFVFSRRRNS